LGTMEAECPSDWVIVYHDREHQYYFVSRATGQQMVRKRERDTPEEVWAQLRKAERADRRQAKRAQFDRRPPTDLADLPCGAKEDKQQKGKVDKKEDKDRKEKDPKDSPHG
jgi:hypothetical protein